MEWFINRNSIQSNTPPSKKVEMNDDRKSSSEKDGNSRSNITYQQQQQKHQDLSGLLEQQQGVDPWERQKPLNKHHSSISGPRKQDDELSLSDKINMDDPTRQQWVTRFDFIISVIGFAVGLGNIWRFPYLCYKNGGGAFLIPYVIFLLCGGIPIFFLEISLGQYMSRGGWGVWNICPLLQGIGVATTVVVFLLNIYYIVVLAWALYYSYFSLTTLLPWSHCNNTWNTPRCRVSFSQDLNLTSDLEKSNGLSNFSLDVTNIPKFGSIGDSDSILVSEYYNSSSYHVDPVVEFWEKKILELSPGIDHPDGVVWPLVLSLLVVWVMCYFCIWKGVKWTGKVMYFTATFPYLVLTVLFIRGITLEGAADGIIFYLKPQFSKLLTSQVWLDAGTQIFFTYAAGFGAMTALGSYNKFNYNCYRDCFIISSVNSLTSFYAGFAVFSVLGFMAREQNVHISLVAESGPGLAFIAYPKAVTQMYGAPVWALLFFIMIFVVGFDSQFVGIEAFVTIGQDLFPYLTRKKEMFIAVYCAVSYLLGLTMVTRGGMYVFQLFDFYACSGMALLWICFFQCIAISWIYGVERFYDNIEQMIGRRIGPWLKICWKYVTPSLIISIFVFMWARFEPLTYNRAYKYPIWAQLLGVGLAASSMICIPAVIIFKYCASFIRSTSLSCKQRWQRLTTPILMPQRVPSHWPDSISLKLIGQKHHPKCTELMDQTIRRTIYRV